MNSRMARGGHPVYVQACRNSYVRIALVVPVSTLEDAVVRREVLTIMITRRAHLMEGSKGTKKIWHANSRSQNLMPASVPPRQRL